jgi:hypothetical protein
VVNKQARLALLSVLASLASTRLHSNSNPGSLTDVHPKCVVLNGDKCCLVNTRSHANDASLPLVNVHPGSNNSTIEECCLPSRTFHNKYFRLDSNLYHNIVALTNDSCIPSIDMLGQVSPIRRAKTHHVYVDLTTKGCITHIVGA